MDLRWHLIMRIEWMEDYIKKHYWEVPRIRAIRFMELEWPLQSEQGDIKMFNKYCWKKIINIHTRCWWNNYESCWWEEWEEELKKKWLFIDWHDERFDCTYRDTYVKVEEDEEYKNFLEKIKELYDE